MRHIRGGARALTPFLATALLAASCRQVAGLDGNWVEGPPSTTAGSGGAGSGGAGSGGSSPCPGCALDKHCDPVLGCVDCLEHAHCLEVDKPVCIDGRCEECAVNDDCRMSMVCWTGHNCGAACQSNQDCSGQEQLCDTPNGVCVQCFDATDCTDAERPLCHPMLFDCVGCVSNADCAAPTPICRPAHYRCVQCLLSSDCAAGEGCVNNVCSVL